MQTFDSPQCRSAAVQSVGNTQGMSTKDKFNVTGSNPVSPTGGTMVRQCFSGLAPQVAGPTFRSLTNPAYLGDREGGCP